MEFDAIIENSPPPSASGEREFLIPREEPPLGHTLVASWKYTSLGSLAYRSHRNILPRSSVAE